jgi:uncharacterized protein (TIGR02569 family)
VTIEPPPDEIAAAFGAAPSSACAVQGGQGATFRVAHLAIKRCDDTDQTEWLSGVMEAVEERGFRIARPVRAKSGSFVVDGWCATRWIDGTTVIEGRWFEAIEACQAFHRALSRVPWSPVLRRPDNPYDRADAAVWAESPSNLNIGPAAERLRGLLEPVTLPSQLIQGDPSEGNLLFAPGLSPGIIDVAPYWHPPAYAIAVLIADSIAWSGAPLSLLAHVASWPEMDQFLIRAVLFRLYVGYLFRGGESAAQRRAAAYAPVIQAVENWPR